MSVASKRLVIRVDIGMLTLMSLGMSPLAAAEKVVPAGRVVEGTYQAQLQVNCVIIVDFTFCSASGAYTLGGIIESSSCLITITGFFSELLGSCNLSGNTYNWKAGSELPFTGYVTVTYTIFADTPIS